MKRMRDRKERRDIYAGIDTKSTQRFGGVCSPFHALALTVSFGRCAEVIGLV